MDLRALLSGVLDRLRPAAERADISLSSEKAMLSLETVAPILEEILYNLVDNAIKYNKKGGKVAVSVERTAGRPASVCRTRESESLPPSSSGSLSASIAWIKAIPKRSAAQALAFHREATARPIWGADSRGKHARRGQHIYTRLGFGLLNLHFKHKGGIRIWMPPFSPSLFPLHLFDADASPRKGFLPAWENQFQNAPLVFRLNSILLMPEISKLRL